MILSGLKRYMWFNIKLMEVEKFGEKSMRKECCVKIQIPWNEKGGAVWIV